MILSLNDYGICPDTRQDAMPALQNLLRKLCRIPEDIQVTVTCQPGKYHFFPDTAFSETLYISNHDQEPNPRKIAFFFRDRKNIILDGQGAEFIFHGIMVPVALINTRNIVIRNFSIDYEFPQIHQLQVLKADAAGHSLLTRIQPYEKPIIQDGKRLSFAEEDNPGYIPCATMSFHPDGRLIPGIADRIFEPQKITELPDGNLEIQGYKEDYKPGDIIALRSWDRPTSAIFMQHADSTVLENITVHYAFGMGVLAQSCDSPTLKQVRVARRGSTDPRCFTTQADATHFVNCSGKITSTDGLYEGMADDAINVHGVYLSVRERLDDCSCRAAFMHEQCYGFDWADVQDSVCFIRPDSMEYLDGEWKITAIEAQDLKNFTITFDRPLPPDLHDGIHYGIENLSRTPEVYFAGNTVRNNRARGALFSTPKEVICEDNHFDYSHGSAILLCGDCNGWFESGACHKVIIRRNRFHNCLTAEYQFTSGIISIYPEIPHLEKQTRPLHGEIIIEDNLFETFPSPILYAKSADRILFSRNKIEYNRDHEPLFPDCRPIVLDHVNSCICKDNQPELDSDQ